MATEKFETALKKLEDIVRRLEGGSLSLDDSLKAFEEGVKHAASAAQKNWTRPSARWKCC